MSRPVTIPACLRGPGSSWPAHQPPDRGGGPRSQRSFLQRPFDGRRPQTRSLGGPQDTLVRRHHFDLGAHEAQGRRWRRQGMKAGVHAVALRRSHHCANPP
jgi:hypothetical protein